MKPRALVWVFVALFAAAFVFAVAQYLLRREPTPEPEPIEPSLVVRVLDVGQGDAILVETPERKFVLVDSGPPEARDALQAALRAAGVTRVDLLVATHPHLDHIGNMVQVLEAYEVGRVLDSGQRHATNTQERMLTAIRERGVPFTVAKVGQEFDLDSGARLDVLSPPQPPLSDDDENRRINANSVVLRLVYGGFRMLLMGDAEEATERSLVASGGDLSAQMLKVAHHGSRYATSADLLARVRPETAIISVGLGNDYHHPTQETLDRLRAAGVRIYRTDLQGTITVRSDGRGYTVEAERAVADAALWRGGKER